MFHIDIKTTLTYHINQIIFIDFWKMVVGGLLPKFVWGGVGATRDVKSGAEGDIGFGET